MAVFGVNARVNLIPCGHQQITSLSGATALTAPSNTAGTTANVACIQAETQNVRYRDDGTDPTASVGTLLYAGDQPTWIFGNLNAYKFIEATASAKLNVMYYRAE